LKKRFFKKNACLSILLLCIFGIISYSNTLNTPFVFDDKDNILNNQHIRMTDFSIDSLAQILKSPAPNRPVANFTFALNYFLLGYNLPGFHVVNLLIHVLTAIFIFFIFCETLTLNKIKGRLIPFFAAALWVVNPVHTQSVTYIVQRMNSLSALFYLVSFLFYIKARVLYKNNDSNRCIVFFTLISVVSGLAALGSKEIAITLPPAIILYDWFFFQDLSSGWLKKKYGLILIFIVIFVLAIIMFLGMDPINKILMPYKYRDFTLYQRLLTEPRVVVFYISLLLFPHPSRLNLDHDFSISHSLVDPLSTVAAIILIFSLVLGGYLLRRKEKLLSFSIFWFLGNLLLESSFLCLELIFEHRTYLPSVFLFVALTAFLMSKIKPRWIPMLILCICIGVCTGWTFQRNNVWQNEISLWQDCVKKSPEKPRPHVYLAILLAKNGQIAEAIEHNKKAIYLDPTNKKAHIELGADFLLMGDYKNSIDYLGKAIVVAPESSVTHYNLGIAYLCTGKIEKAMISFQHALTLSPNNKKVLGNLQMADKFYKEIKAATITLEESLENLSAHHAANDADFQKAKQNLDNVVEKYKKALVYQPGFKKERFSILDIDLIQPLLLNSQYKILL
jgi:tetratricopeptide (TPR) repeat protein